METEPIPHDREPIWPHEIELRLAVDALFKRIDTIEKSEEG